MSTGDLRPSKKLPESAHLVVISNDDLLIEILLRLPILSLILFKSVSKRWLSLIKSSNFTRKLDPPCGLFLKFDNSCHKYKFLPLDTRIPSCSSFTFGHNAPSGNLYILHSCNGLLLCLCLTYNKLYVYNPSVSSMYKMIPEPPNLTFDPSSAQGASKTMMAFDPTKSPHYKVIHWKLKHDDDDVDVWVQIYIYSSETGVWSACEDRFHVSSSMLFVQHDGVYWNDAIHWVSVGCGPVWLFKLDILNERPVLTTSKAPFIFDREDGLEYKLFNSRGCLLLVSKGTRDSNELYVYEMRSECSEWSVKYIVNLTVQLPKRWNVQSIVSCVYLGERDEDSFIVIRLSKKVVQYKIVSKTLHTLANIRAESHDRCFEYIASFANV